MVSNEPKKWKRKGETRLHNLMEHLRLWLVKNHPIYCHCLVEYRMDSSIQGKFLRRKTAVCFLVIIFFSFLFSFDNIFGFIFWMLVCHQTKRYIKSSSMWSSNKNLKLISLFSLWFQVRVLWLPILITTESLPDINSKTYKN